MPDTSMLGLPRLDEPCQRCNWKYEGYHVCFDASTEYSGEGFVEFPEGKPAKRPRAKATGSNNSRLDAANEGYQAYIDKRRAHNAPRDLLIIETYKSGKGLRETAAEFGVGYQTVVNLIKNLEHVSGEKIMRSRNSYSRAKEVNDGMAP